MEESASAIMLIGLALLNGLGTDELLKVSKSKRQKNVTDGRGVNPGSNVATANTVETDSRFEKAMKLQADEAKKLVASIVAGIPDLTRPRAASLFYEILILSSGQNPGMILIL